MHAGWHRWTGTVIVTDDYYCITEVVYIDYCTGGGEDSDLSYRGAAAQVSLGTRLVTSSDARVR